MKYINPQFVRWDDLDAFGHLNNAKYLTLIQEARFQWAYSETASRSDAPAMVEMVVGRAEIDFVAAIYEGGRNYDIHLWVESLGNASFVMQYEVIGDNGKVHARIKTVQVAISLETKKSRPLTDIERDFLSRYFA